MQKKKFCAILGAILPRGHFQERNKSFQSSFKLIINSNQPNQANPTSLQLFGSAGGAFGLGLGGKDTLGMGVISSKRLGKLGQMTRGRLGISSAGSDMRSTFRLILDSSSLTSASNLSMTRSFWRAADRHGIIAFHRPSQNANKRYREQPQYLKIMPNLIIIFTNSMMKLTIKIAMINCSIYSTREPNTRYKLGRTIFLIWFRAVSLKWLINKSPASEGTCPSLDGPIFERNTSLLKPSTWDRYSPSRPSWPNIYYDMKAPRMPKK